MEQRLAEERMRKMEQENKHLLANLFSQKPILNQSLVQSLSQNQLFKPKLNQNTLQRTQTGSISQPRIQVLPELQQPSQNIAMLSLQRNPTQTQQRTHNSWSNNPSTTNHGPLPNMANFASRFYPQSFPSPFPQLKSPSFPPHNSTPSPGMSSKNPLDEILDLTVSSPSPPPDTTEGGLNRERVTRHSSAFEEDFNLEALISQTAPNAQHAPQVQQQTQSPLTNNQQDFLDFFDLSLCPQMLTQKTSPPSSTSSVSSSTSSVSNTLVSHVPVGLVPSSTLISPSSSLFSSPSSSSPLFSNSFSSPYLLPQSDPLPLPNGTSTLDVREALNSMLQAGPDRKSVIQYRHQD